MKKLFKKVKAVGKGIGHVAGGIADIACVIGYGIYCKITGKELF